MHPVTRSRVRSLSFESAQNPRAPRTRPRALQDQLPTRKRHPASSAAAPTRFTNTQVKDHNGKPFTFWNIKRCNRTHLVDCLDIRSCCRFASHYALTHRFDSRASLRTAESILSRPLASHPLPSDFSDTELEVHNRIIHYNIDEFQRSLNKFDLHKVYPRVIPDLKNGCPIADLPTHPQTVVIPKHRSVGEHPDAVREYIDKEVVANCLSSSYTLAEAERIYNGFICSPLIGAVQDNGPDVPLKKRVRRNLSKGDTSIPRIT